MRDAVRTYANPTYHIRKAVEDLRAMWTALRDLRVPIDDPVALKESFRGKLLACFYTSGPFSWIGVALSVYIQKVTQNPVLAQYSLYVLNMFICSSAYQILWAVGNRGLYRGKAGFIQFERDLMPVHGSGIRLGMTLNLISWPLTTVVILIIQWLNKQAALAIPAAAFTIVFDALIVQTTFMRLMGDWFEQWADVLVTRHARRPALTSPGVDE